MHWSQQTQRLKHRSTLLLFQRQQNRLDFLYVTAQNVWYQGLVLEVETNTWCNKCQPLLYIDVQISIFSNIVKHCKLAKARKWPNLLNCIRSIFRNNIFSLSSLSLDITENETFRNYVVIMYYRNLKNCKKWLVEIKLFTDFLHLHKVCNKWRKSDIQYMANEFHTLRLCVH